MATASSSLTRITLGIMFLVLLSKAIGFFREIIVAHRFGTGLDYDVYLIAITVPMALFTLISGLSNLFIPVCSAIQADGDFRERVKRLWADFNGAILAAVVLSAFICLSAPTLLPFLAPGLEAENYSRAVFITRVATVLIVLSMLETCFRSILNAEKKFAAAAFGPVIANAVLVGILIALAHRLSVLALLYGTIAGIAVQVIILLLAVRSTAVAQRFSFQLWHSGTGQFVTAAGLIMLIEAASQAYALVDRYFASSMPAGVVSALGYAYVLFHLPVSVVAFALATVLFPYLADSLEKGDRSESGRLLTRGIEVSLLLAIPFTMIFFVFSRELVTVIYQRGAFTASSAAATSELIDFFIFGITGQFLLWLLFRAYYAARKYRLLIINVVILIIIKMAASWALAPSMGAIGLAVASSLSYTGGAVFLLLLAGPKVAPVDGRAVLVYFVKLLPVTAAGGGLAYLARETIIQGNDLFAELIWRLPLSLVLVLAALIGIGWVFRIEEVRGLFRGGKNRSDS